MTHVRNTRIRIKDFLDKLRSREITNREVAAALGVSEEHVSRTLAEIGFEKEPAVDRKAQSAAKKARKHQIRVDAKTMSPEDLAKTHDISVRTAYRYIDAAKADGA